MLFKEIFRHFKKEEMQISNKGLLYGILNLLRNEHIESPMFFKNYLTLAMEKFS